MSIDEKREGERRATLPESAAERKNLPMVRGLLDYFPAALAAVADVSRIGNEQHNPGQPMHHARGKSNDHADCAVRHLMDRGLIDTDKLRHTAKAAWRVLALLQEELEAAGAPMARGAKLYEPEKPVLMSEPIRDQSASEDALADAFDMSDRLTCHHKGEWWCTRGKGHSGDHIATDGLLVLDRWPQKVVRHG